MKISTQKPYFQSVDIIRIISISAVILIHTTTRTLEATSFNFSREFWSLFLNQITRFAVPLFFMVSGFVLELNSEFYTNYWIYLKKRIGKILVPYLFWSLIYYFFVYTQHGENFFSALISGSSSHQLYFIPTLLIFYIIFPIIHKISHFLFNTWVLILMGILQVFILYYDYYISPLPIVFQISILLLNYYIFLLGMFTAHNYKNLSTIIYKWKIILIPLTLLLGTYVFIEGRSRYLLTNNYLAFYSQWRPSVLFYTISLASILYFLLNKKGFNSTLIKTLSGLSFFVFFIHIIILEIVWYYVGYRIFNLINSGPLYLLFNLSYFFFIFFSSYFIALIVHKIPYLSRLTG